MRTLSAELTSAQQAVSNTPHLEVEFTSRDMATNLTYKTDDATNRVLRIRTAEGFFGGSLFEIAAPNGDIVPIAAQILLRNSDNEFTSKDLRGYKTEIKWGFKSYWNGSSTVSITGIKTSQGEPYWVFSQKDHSLEGEVITELQCISAWYYLALEKIMGTGFGDTYVATGKTIRGLLFDVLTDHATKVFTFNVSEVGSEFTDITTNIQDESSSSTIPMDLGDHLYIGVTDEDIKEIDRITIYGTVNGVYTVGSPTWQYFNGSIWTALSIIDDETDLLRDMDVGVSDFVPKVVSFTLPTDMAATAINGSTLRWVRLNQIVGISASPAPVINRIGVHRFWGLSNTDPDLIENNVNTKPDFEVSFDTSRLELLRILLDQTNSSFVMQENFFKMTVIDNIQTLTDYDYDLGGTHTFFTDVRERTALIPNEVIVTNIQNNGPADFSQFAGNSADSDEQASWGPIIELQNDASLISDARAVIRAVNRIQRYREQRYQGEFSAPINIGLEPWDFVSVTDDRLGLTTKGRVGRVIREYNQAEGIYRDVITLGTPKWAATLSLNRALHDRRSIARPTFGDEGVTFDLPFAKVPEAVIPLRTQPIPAGLNFPALHRGLGPQTINFDLDAGPFDLGIPYARDGYAPRKYNINPETYGFVQKEMTVDVLAFRDFQKNLGGDLLAFQDTANSYTGLVLEQNVAKLLQLRSANVAHGITDLIPTSTWAYFAQAQENFGGLLVGGVSERITGRGLQLLGIATSSATTLTKTLVPYILLHAAKKSTTTVQDVGATEVLVGIVNNDANTNLFLGDGSLIWFETGAGNNYVGLVAPAVVTADVIYTLPPADGSSGDHLRTDGSGVLTWETPSAGGGGWTDDGTDVRLTTVTDDVGIGIATPDSKLHVMEASAGAVSAANNAVITLEDNTRAWLSFLSPTDAGIAFGNVADNDIGRIWYQHSDNTLRIDAGAQEVFVISSSVVHISQDVGIGIAAPDAQLHVWKGNAGTVVAHTSARIVIEDNTAVNLNFLTPNTSNAAIVFGDEDDNQIGLIVYDHNTGIMTFKVEGSNVARFKQTDFELSVGLEMGGNALWDLDEETSDPTLASMNNAEIRIGQVGSGTNDGRIWIESGGRVYRFNSFTSYT